LDLLLEALGNQRFDVLWLKGLLRILGIQLHFNLLSSFMYKKIIDKKIEVLKKQYCPNANILVEYPNMNKDTEAEVDLRCMKSGENKFILRIFPSFNCIGSESQKDFVLRHELIHVKDAMSPEFKYDYNFLCVIINNIPEFESVMSKMIWDLSIDMRLEKEGYSKVLDYGIRINYFKQGFLNLHWTEYINEFSFDINLVKKLVQDEEVTLDKIKDIASKIKEQFVKKITEKQMKKIFG